MLGATNLMRSHTQTSHIRLKRTFVVVTVAREKFITPGPKKDTKKQKKIKFDPTDELWKSDINLNEDITKALGGVALLEKERKSGDPFKQRAYENAIYIITSYPARIISGAEAKKLQGIGSSIANKIDEILKTGTCESLKEKQEDAELFETFSQVFGVGPVAAKRFVDKGYKSISDLANDPDLTDMQRLGIKYVDDFKLMIPKVEAQGLIHYVQDVLKELSPAYIGIACDGHRRELSETNSLYMAITHPNYTSSPSTDPGRLLLDLTDALTDLGFLTDHISSGILKYWVRWESIEGSTI
ncbi:10115_t:CDS:2 [Paraglomus occultum]|uniref:DNA polymerase n=1 Tax=Paraglomus occultum TaxID=144539 RepID=A0A9N9F2T4_9GLOM|nr:10115_t:CDS:2 [Paraglomus occultum]